MDKFLYTSRFETVAKFVNPDEQDRFIATASLLPLKGILNPGVRPEDNPDMLFFSANGAVAGMMNRNGDAIDCETAILINDTAKNKYVSTEHQRDAVCGLVIHPGFSRFGSNEPLTVEEASTLKEPFNMSVVGALWKVINPMLVKYLQKQGEDTDEMALSLSWEIAFNAYVIGVGSKNIFDARIITPDDPEFDAYKKYLRCEKGEGKNEKSEPVFRIIQGSPVILGYSIVANPAAEVKGILPIAESVPTKEVDANPAPIPVEEKAAETQKDLGDNNLNQEKTPVLVKKVEIIQEKSINLSNARVTSNTSKTMKIEKLEQLNAEWAEISKMESAAAVVDFVKAIQDGSEEFAKKLEERENALKLADEAKAASEKALKETQETLAQVKQELDQIRASQDAEKTAQTYQARMAAIDSEFELDDEDRQLIASDIKDLDDESFAKYMSKCKKLMSGKCKSGKAAKDGGKKMEKEEEMEEEEECAKKKAKAAAEEEAKIKAAVASVTENPDQGKVPNTTSTDVSLLEQMKAAFGESFKVDGKPVTKKKVN
jgi:hypothetical protein